MKEIITKIINNIKNLKIYSCKNLPPCRRCGSPKTAYYLELDAISIKEADKITAEHLRKGEYVITVCKTEGPFSSGVNKCKCLNCQHSWTQSIEVKYYTYDERMKISKEKGITDELVEKTKNFNKEYLENIEKEKFLNKRAKMKEFVNKNIIDLQFWK